jgi:uncharacterized BrkB/YihY/UPF0761 family membrane protein
MDYSFSILKRATITSIVIIVLAYGIGVVIGDTPNPIHIGGAVVGVFVLHVFFFPDIS